MSIELPLLHADLSDPILIFVSMVQIFGISMLIRLGFLFVDWVLEGGR